MQDKLFAIWKRKETAYRTCLGNEMGKDILRDLNLFCNGTRSNFDSDALMMARMEGRREVFNRIMTFLKIDVEEYIDLADDYNPFNN